MAFQMTMNISPDWNNVAEMVRRVRSTRGRSAAGLYAIEGDRLIRRALRAGAPVQAMLVAESYGTDNLADDLLSAAKKSGIPVTIAPAGVIYELTSGRDQGAIVALVAMPRAASLTTLLDEGQAPTLFLAAVDIVDPGNAGALVRTAHAAGAAATLAAGASDPFHPRAARISRGSIFKCPVIDYESAEALLLDLQAHHVLSVATVVDGGQPLDEVTWPQNPLAVLMGNEGDGLAQAVQDKVDICVSIPMAPGVDSLAVNAAAAVLLYDIRRQWDYYRR